MNSKNILSSNIIPYGSTLNVKNGAKIKKDDLICSWDPFNGVIVSEFSGKISMRTLKPVLLFRLK